MNTWKKMLNGFLILASISIADFSWAAEPTANPLPRLETGMHTVIINRMATDLSGRWVVTASDDKTARVWEVATGNQVMVLRPPQDIGEEGMLYAVAMSPDGATVAVAGWTQFNDGKKTISPEGHFIYFFDRASGHLLRRFSGLRNVALHMDWSPNGRWLVAALGADKKGQGVRVFDTASGAEVGRGADYGDQSYSAHFSSNSRRLVTTCFDGQVRLYAVEEGDLRLIKAERPGGGNRPFSARFSSDDRLIAVGYDDSRVVQILDAETLAEVAQPSIVGLKNGDLSKVAWSADGRNLLAAGSWQLDGKRPLRRWPVGDWSHYRDVPLTNDTVMDLKPLPDGGLLFAAADPTWGVLDRDGRILRRQDGVLADLRNQRHFLGLSANGQRVRFGYHPWGKGPRVFDVASRSLGADNPQLAKARTQAPGLTIENWKNETNPSVNGRLLKLKPYEIARSLSISADGHHFVLGADWYVRMYDHTGKQVWAQSAPGAVWAVNISANDRYVVAAYSDGTIRWHRYQDGKEVLAFFPHADKKRWVAWTPEGFYSASGPDAESLMGYHLNRGKDKEGEFVSAQQLREKFYQPALISARLDPDGDRRLAEAVAKLGDVRKLLVGAGSRLPLVEVLNGSNVQGDEAVTVSVKVRDQGGGIGGLVYYVDGQPEAGRLAGVVGDATDSRVFALPRGKHRIEVAARNAAGVEGPRQLVIATVTGPGSNAALHIFAVGIEDYRAPGMKLKHSVADAQAVADVLATRAMPLFKRGVSKPVVLRDEQASLDGIEKAFAELKQRMKPEDTLVIFFAGHGEAPIDKGYTFLTWDFARGAAGPRGEGLNEKRLMALLEQSPRQTLLLLDTCDAGGAVEMLEASYDRLYGMSRRVIIGASRRGQFAKEGYQGHGVFTAGLLRVLQEKPDDDFDHTLRVPELRVAVDKEVQKIVRKMGSNYLQTVSGYLGSANFPVVAR